MEGCPGRVGQVGSAAGKVGPDFPADSAGVGAPEACQAWGFGLSVDGECWAGRVGGLEAGPWYYFGRGKHC